MARANFTCCILTPDLSLGLPDAADNMDFSPKENVKQ